jgi:hypothetical protein
LTAPHSVALPFNAREQWDRLPNNMPIGQLPPPRILETKPFFFSTQLHLPIQLIENPMRRLRQYRRNQNRDDTKRFGEGIENCDEIKLGKPTTRTAASES